MIFSLVSTTTSAQVYLMDDSGAQRLALCPFRGTGGFRHAYGSQPPGGTRQRHFAGTSFEPRKLLKNAHVASRQSHPHTCTAPHLPWRAVPGNARSAKQIGCKCSPGAPCPGCSLPGLPGRGCTSRTLSLRAAVLKGLCWAAFELTRASPYPITSSFVNGFNGIP
jgi:hypothetical protein